MKKLIYLANVRMPTEKAHGIQIASMCEAFGSMISTVLYTPYRSHNKKSSDIFTYYDLNKSSFNSYKINTYLSSFYSFIPNKLVYWFRNFVFILKSLFLIKTDEQTIIYTRQPEIAFVFKVLKKGITIYEDHGWPNSKIWLYKYLTKRIDKIVVITKGIKEKYKNEGINTSKILVAHDGVDIEKFDIDLSKKEAREKCSLPKEKRILMYTGSFFRYDWKGIDLILEVSKRFSKKYRFVLVGGKREEIQRIETQYDMSNLELLEYKPHKKIPLFLKAADVLLLPNKPINEKATKYTSPLKIFEYMAGNRPIIASNTPSIKEVLNEKTALFFNPNDLGTLEDSIKFCFNEQSKVKNKAKRANEKVEQYSWDRRAKKIIKFIKYE